MTVAELVKGAAELVEDYELKKIKRFIQYVYSSFISNEIKDCCDKLQDSKQKRTTSACTECRASKRGCSDQKPCTRCIEKGLTCKIIDECSKCRYKRYVVEGKLYCKKCSEKLGHDQETTQTDANNYATVLGPAIPLYTYDYSVTANCLLRIVPLEEYDNTMDPLEEYDNTMDPLEEYYNTMGSLEEYDNIMDPLEEHNNIMDPHQLIFRSVRLRFS
ncbi:19442_t:CDS:2 [Cetraspora pellucida]|uniref:19442_t:CDS:1 n=1 Tax=Cetraspora pellucida TaxID=1433469 RepID=A0A9N9HB40_9GLOM|nr:19442_t:CDS:2 [Cetraspora pellucida]